MTGLSELGNYQVCSSRICKVLMSTDNSKWENVEYNKISAGGLSFLSKKLFQITDRLYLNLSIYNMLSEFNMSFEGVVTSKSSINHDFIYTIKFDKIEKYNRIQLDEIIKSRVTILQQKYSHFHDGVYSFMFMPKEKKLHERISNF